MKRIIVLLLFLATSARAQIAPYAVTQLASNETTSSMILRATVSAGGTNANWWFTFGTDPSVLATGGVTAIGGTTTQAVNATQSGLLAGTRYYYQVIVSNAIGVTTGTIQNSVTTQITYDFTGTGFQNIDITRPYGSEPGSVWDDALRQFKAATVSANDQTHDIFGNLLPGIVVNSNIAAGAVTLDKLGADVISTLATSVVSSVAVTNAMNLQNSIESDGVTYQMTGQAEKNIGSSTISSNKFRNVLVDASIILDNESSERRNVIMRIKSAGIVQKEFIVRITAGTTVVQSISTMFAGGNSAVNTIDIVVAGDNNTAHQTAQLKYIRVWGIP